MMNARHILSALAAIAVIETSPLVASACDANFTLYNRTALPILRVQVSPSDRTSFTPEDYLGSDTVDPEASYDIDVNDHWQYNGRFDIRVDWGNDLTMDAYSVPLCSRDTVVVTPEGITSH